VRAELAAICEFYGAAADDAGVRLTVVAPADGEARADRALFQRAVGNLLSNALAYTPGGGTVAVTAMVDERGVEVTVADTGCGIAPQHLPHLGQRFFRVDPSRPSSGDHVGLGLAIVRGIVEQHGGTVSIASILGRGTRVSLSFPRG
jgi:two-component system heavy metal sensor histidine kinase CusS